MKRRKRYSQDGNHKWVAIVRDPDKPNYLIDTNEYLVTHGGQGMLLDRAAPRSSSCVFGLVLGILIRRR